MSLALLLASLALPALACDPRQAVAFSDGSRVCLHERPELPLPADRRQWRPAFHALYSVAASQDAGCPLALGVGSNNNSPLATYADRRDVSAVQQCRGELRRQGAPAHCDCRLLIKDGAALIERTEFEALVSRAAPRPDGPPMPAAPASQAAAPADIPAPKPPALVASPPPAAAAAASAAASAAVAPAPRAAAVAPSQASSEAPPALQPPRRALLIGNRDYVVGRLKNPINDARAMDALLRRLSFQTTLIENLRREDIGTALDRFTASVQPGDDVLIFYAGHGLQIRGLNYLPAVDAQIRTESDVPLNSIHLNQLLERLDEARAGVRLLLIDACRDNPYARSYRSGMSGLARIDLAPAGTLIHFATRPGGISADGDGDHGLYTKHLLQHLATPALPVEQMLKRVASAVRRESGNEQLPWTEGSLDGDFYFVPPRPTALPR